MDDSGKPRRGWQFSIRAVLILTALVAVLAAIFAVWGRRPGQRQLIVHITAQGTVTFGGNEMQMDQLLPLHSARRLSNNRQVDGSEGATTILIRAHRDASTRHVVELINVCQVTGFEKLSLQAGD